MPRGRRPASPSTEQLQQELDALKAREKELRVLLRQQGRAVRGGAALRRLQERLEGQLGRAKWYAAEIRQLDPSFNELAFYHAAQAQQPKPRGPRRRRSEPAAE